MVLAPIGRDNNTNDNGDAMRCNHYPDAYKASSMLYSVIVATSHAGRVSTFAHDPLASRADLPCNVICTMYVDYIQSNVCLYRAAS